MGNTIRDEHNSLVEYVARYLKRRFYRDIRARAEGYPPPARVPDGFGGVHHTPDVTMLARGEQLNVIEVETESSLADQGTGQKWRTLARFAADNDGRFLVAVPSGLGETARVQLSGLEFPGEIWELQHRHREPRGT